MATSTTKIGDFHILPILIPPLPSFPHIATHHIYLRRNERRVPSPDDSRTLFLTNLPVDSTELHLRALIADLVGIGRFESAAFEDDGKAGGAHGALDFQPAQAKQLAAHTVAAGKKRKLSELQEDAERQQREEREEAAARLPSAWARTLHRSGGTATVLLADAKSAELVLQAVVKLHNRSAKDGKKKKKTNFPIWGALVPDDDRVPSLGAGWLAAHARLSYPDKAAVQVSVDAFFELFNRREREAAELAKRLRSEPDEDGFVTVVRGGSTRVAPVGRAEAEEARRKMLEKEEKRKSGMGTFYRFQVREKRKAEQEELVRKFEEDRRMVDSMREKKGRFKPEA